MRSISLTVAIAAVSGLLLMATAFVSPAEAGQKKKPKKAPAATGAPTKAVIEEGKKVYMVNGCKACHVIGDDKGGKTGPELTHVARTRKPEWMSAQVRDPKKFDPKSTMPAYGTDKINGKQIKSLVAYMSTLK